MKRHFAIPVAALCVPLMLVASATAQFKLPSFGKSEPSKKIAYFKIGAMTETPQNLAPMFTAEPPPSLKGTLDRMSKARDDESVRAIILDVESARLGFAQLFELHEAMRRFAAVDKDVFLHADMLTTGTYVLATSAQEISMVPTGDLWLTGLYGSSPYLKGLLDTIGVKADFLTCGDHKSAAEPLMRTGPSPEAQEMTDWLLDSLYTSLVDRIAEARDMDAEQVSNLIDNGPYTAEDALAAGLIDSVEHRQDFLAAIKDRYGKDIKIVMDYGKKDPFAEIPEDPFGAWTFIVDKIVNPKKKSWSEDSIAIVYVEGAISTGTGKVSPFGSDEGAFSTSIRKALDQAAEDDSVKAVVLRVDSPGGSATASEIIWHATQRVAAKKPFLVSMGNVAASGGYYVSCGADMIFADPTTITGSIGVVGGKIVTTEMWDHVGINWVDNKRGRMADIMSGSSMFSDEQRAKIQGWMNQVYGVFKGRVTQGRENKLAKPLDEIAGGRVYTGEQALELGLVDKLGGLHESIKEAARRAGLDDYKVRVVPEPPTIFDVLFGNLDEDEYAATMLPKNASLFDSLAVQTLMPLLETAEPGRAAAIRQALTCLELIHEEKVVTMMPSAIVID